MLSIVSQESANLGTKDPPKRNPLFHVGYWIL